MARGTIKQRITLDGGKEIEAQLKALGAAGERAFGQITKAAAKVDINFGKRLDNFGRDLARTGKQLAFVFAGINTAGLAAAGAIAAVAKSGADAADAAGKAAQSAGLQVDAYGRLAFAAEQNDVAAEAFGAAMSKLNKAIGEAAGGSKEAKAKFAALGVSITDARGKLKPTEVIVQDLAEAFSKMPDGVKKSAAAIGLLGKSGASLIPFLNEGKDGLIKLGDTAEHLGIVFTGAQTEIGDALGDALAEVQRATGGLKNQIGLLFAPAITVGAIRLRDAIIANKDAILAFARDLVNEAIPVIKDVIAALSGDDKAVKNIWILAWRDAVIGFGKAVQSVFSGVVLPVLSLFKKTLDGVAAALRAVTGINIDGTMIAIALAVGQVTGAFRLMRSAALLAWAAFNLLKANPIVAAISIATSAVAGGLALWALRTDNATAAMEHHETVVNSVGAAYDKAGRKVAAMTNQVKLQSLIDTRANIGDLQKSFDTQLAELRGHLSEQMGLIAKSLDVSAQTGRAPPKILEQWRPFMAAIDAFVKGGSLTAFVAQVRQIGAANPALNNVAKALTDQAQSAEGLFGKLKEESDWIALLSGKMSDAEFQARNFTEGQNAVANAAGEASTKVAETAKQVDKLNKTITVHSSDAAGKPIQQTFDLAEGLGKAAEQSKQSLDDVSESATKAGDTVGKVKDDISALIIHVPEELKGQPTIADAMTTGLSEVPAAAKVAADGVIAEVSRIQPAIAGSLAGGVKPAEAGGEQQAQATGGIADTLSKPFTDARDKIAEALASIPANVTLMLQTVQTAATEIGAGLSQLLIAPFEQAATRIAEILERMTSAVETQFAAMLAAVRSMTSQLQSAVATLESLAARAEAAASRARAATSSAGERANGGPVTRMAGGGLARSGGGVSGPGTATSDSILTRLSDGEFVLRAAAVRKYGSGLLAMLNSLRLPKDFMKGLRLAGGGMVSRLTDGMRVPAMVPAFADGGQVAAPSSSGRPINLNFDGQTYQLIAPEDVADRLAKHNGRRGLRIAGKAPSWK
jgi:uncharacterized phage infection (PIP) family protein YhgE